MLVSDFIVNSTLKTLKGISIDCFNDDSKKKKDGSCSYGIGMIKSLPVPNCLISVTHESYVFK